MRTNTLENQIALVTGAGKGIGRETAIAVARQGALVICVARTADDLAGTVSLIQQNGGKAELMCCDLTEESEVSALIDSIIKKQERIDILVNNAGGYPKEIYDKIDHQAIRIWEWSEEQWDQIIKTNLKIPFLCTKYVVPIMIRQSSGKIVNISSRMGRIPSQMGAYAVAKGGIITMTKTTAIQVKEYGIQVNAVAPGMVDTPGQRIYNENVGQTDAMMGSAADVANAVVYLLCEAPPVMTGQVMDLFSCL